MCILTIDDEENIRNGLADNFELEGYEVKQAASGEEGLSLIAQGGISIDGNRVEDADQCIFREQLATGIKIRKGKKTYRCTEKRNVYFQKRPWGAVEGRFFPETKRINLKIGPFCFLFCAYRSFAPLRMTRGTRGS